MLLAGAAIAIFLAIPLPAPAQTTVNVLTADAQVGASGGINETGSTASIGNRGDSPRYVAVLPLPVLPENHRFAQASFRIVARNYNSYDQNAHLHGLPYRTAPAVQPADYSAAGTMLQEAFSHPGMSSAWNPICASAEGDAALTAYLNAQQPLARRTARPGRASISSCGFPLSGTAAAPTATTRSTRPRWRADTLLLSHSSRSRSRRPRRRF